MEYLNQEIIIKIIEIVGIVFVLTFLQKYHFKMLHFIKHHLHGIASIIISTILRLGIILHEISHLIPAILFGAKINKINLFDKKGGSVDFSIKDYIGHIGHTKGGLVFWVFLILNRIGFFLISLGPLLAGVFLNILLINFFMENTLFSTSISISLENISVFEGIILTLYSIIFIPSFILSYKDISNLFFYKGYNIFESIVGSIVNFGVLIIFLFSLTFIYKHFLIFFVFYVISFLVTFIFFLIIKLKNYLKL